MSVSAKNNGTLVCGLTADPEVFQDKVVRFRLAADYAGQDQANPDNHTGYFSGTYFLNSGSQNADFVGRQVKEGKLKKGSQVIIAYRLRQERWVKDDKNGQNVVLIIEDLTYSGGTGGGNRSDGESKPTADASTGPAPTEF